jgi:predicted RNase H-like HicB family nuclease
MVVDAKTPEDAVKKITEIIEQYKKEGKTPNVWGE